MNNILFFNKKCNLRCDYCHFKYNEDGFTAYGKKHIFGDELEPETLLKGLEQFAPYHVEFTGSEPLMYKGFKNVVNNLPDGCTWAITSNTLLDVSGIDFDKCIAWTASYHGFKQEKFEENLKVLVKELGGRVSASFVVTFDNTRDVLRTANEMRQRFGTRINLLRELNPDVSWKGTAQLKLLRSMPEPFFNVVEDDIPLSYEFENGFNCTGGSDYICLYTDGKVFSCYSNAMNNKPLGTIDTYKKREGAADCWDECLGCAEDHKSRLKKL